MCPCEKVCKKERCKWGLFADVLFAGMSAFPPYARGQNISSSSNVHHLHGSQYSNVSHTHRSTHQQQQQQQQHLAAQSNPQYLANTRQVSIGQSTLFSNNGAPAAGPGSNSGLAAAAQHAKHAGHAQGRHAMPSVAPLRPGHVHAASSREHNIQQERSTNSPGTPPLDSYRHRHDVNRTSIAGSQEVVDAAGIGPLEDSSQQQAAALRPQSSMQSVIAASQRAAHALLRGNKATQPPGSTSRQQQGDSFSVWSRR